MMAKVQYTVFHAMPCYFKKLMRPISLLTVFDPKANNNSFSFFEKRIVDCGSSWGYMISFNKEWSY